MPKSTAFRKALLRGAAPAPGHMPGFALRAVVDLVPAAGAVGHDDRVGPCAHGRQQAQLGHLHRHVVVRRPRSRSCRPCRSSCSRSARGSRAGNQLAAPPAPATPRRRPSGGSGRAPARGCVQRPQLAAQRRPAGRPRLRAPGTPRTAAPARPAPAPARPGPCASISSRSVSRHDGSRPTMAMPSSDEGLQRVPAARRALALASSTMPLAR